MNQDNLNKSTENITEEEAITKKKISVSSIVTGVVIAVILLVFAGIVVYQNVIKPSNEMDSMIEENIGANIDDCISLGEYKGLSVDITQEEYDECISQDTDSYVESKKAAEYGDEIEIKLTGYINGKKDTAISQNDMAFSLEENQEDIYGEFAASIIGHKKGEIIKLKSKNISALVNNNDSYEGVEAEFEIKILAVSKLEKEKVTDKWVKDFFYDDYGYENVKDYYEGIELQLEEGAKETLWEKAVANSVIISRPQKLTDDVTLEIQSDDKFTAEEEYGLTYEEYIYDFCMYDEASLNERYMQEVNSELLMWAIVKEENIEISNDEIEAKYEELFELYGESYGYTTVDEIKDLYKIGEIKEAIYLEKAHDIVVKNAIINKNYIPVSE